MPKSDTKTQVNVTVNIPPGPASPAAKMAYRKLWQKLIAETRRKVGQ